MLREPSVKAMFKEAYPVPRPRLKGDILAPPISKRPMLIGTAFDYLLRFRMEREFAPCVAGSWVAEDAVAMLNEGVVKCSRGVRAGANSRLAEARAAHRAYMDTGVAGDDLIKSSLDLAQLDAIVRTGRTYDFFVVGADDVGDLRGILDVAVRKFPLPSKSCLLNPTFGKGSHLVGGADADLIIDDTLIDIKTTRTLSFSQDMYNQVVGYYLLVLQGGVDDMKGAEVSSIGVYFARYGLLHTIPTADIKRVAEDGFMSSFEKAAREMFPPIRVTNWHIVPPPGKDKKSGSGKGRTASRRLLRSVLLRTVKSLGR